MRQGSPVRRLFVASFIVAASAIVGGAAGPGTVLLSSVKFAPQDTAVPVTILFMCDGARSVDPWEVRVRSGRDIVWSLDAASDVEDFRVKRKNTNRPWPFLGTGTIDGRKDAPARGRGRPGTAKGTYAYDIEARCRVPGGGTEWKKIDPDIIVDI